MKIVITTDGSPEEVEAARSSAVAVLKMHGKAQLSIDGKAASLADLRGLKLAERAAMRKIQEGERELAAARGKRTGDVRVEVPAGDLLVTPK